MGMMTKLIKMGVLGAGVYYLSEFALIFLNIGVPLWSYGIVPLVPALLIMYWYWNKK